MFEWFTNTATDLYNATFGEMNGKEVFWTIIALLSLYQLVMIKWRLIDQARANGTPSSYMARLRGSIARRRPNLRHVGLGLRYRRPVATARVRETVGFAPADSVRRDIADPDYTYSCDYED